MTTTTTGVEYQRKTNDTGAGEGRRRKLCQYLHIKDAVRLNRKYQVDTFVHIIFNMIHAISFQNLLNKILYFLLYSSIHTEKKISRLKLDDFFSFHDC